MQFLDHLLYPVFLHSVLKKDHAWVYASLGHVFQSLEGLRMLCNLPNISIGLPNPQVRWYVVPLPINIFLHPPLGLPCQVCLTADQGVVVHSV